MSQRMITQLAPWVVAVAFFLIWEAVCQGLNIREVILPAPSRVLVELWNFRAPIWDHSLFTLKTTLIGFIMAVVGGVVLGVVVGSSRIAYAGLYPNLIGFNSIPKVAVVPVLVVWFGIGFWPAVLTAFLISFFPIAVNVATGLATLEPELEDVLRSLGASRTDIIIKVGLPRSAPYFFASLKVAITLAIVGSVISETVAANQGIGYLMVQASSSFRMPLVFAGLIVISVMGILLYVIFALIERQMTGWATRGSGGATAVGG